MNGAEQFGLSFTLWEVVSVSRMCVCMRVLAWVYTRCVWRCVTPFFSNSPTAGAVCFSPASCDRLPLVPQPFNSADVPHTPLMIKLWHAIARLHRYVYQWLSHFIMLNSSYYCYHLGMKFVCTVLAELRFTFPPIFTFLTSGDLIGSLLSDHISTRSILNFLNVIYVEHLMCKHQ